MQRCFCIHINYIHLEVLLFFYYKLSWEPCFMKLLEHPIVLHNCLCLYYSTYWCYIHQTCTNCSSWHDLLIPRGGLCPLPTFGSHHNNVLLISMYYRNAEGPKNDVLLVLLHVFYEVQSDLYAPDLKCMDCLISKLLSFVCISTCKYFSNSLKAVLGCLVFGSRFCTLNVSRINLSQKATHCTLADFSLSDIMMSQSNGPSNSHVTVTSQ